MSLKKIAAMTGVSVSTVSRVLNNAPPSCASKEVKDKIWEAARLINYSPNLYARSLKAGAAADAPGTGYKIAVALARIKSLGDDPFFYELFRCIETELFAKNIAFGGVIKDGEGQIGAQETPSGIIILGRCSEKLLLSLKTITPNLVGIWRNIQNFNTDEIVCDGKKAASAAVEHLISLGHEKIAYIGDCSYESRYVGYCETLIKYQLPLNYKLIIATNQTEAEGRAAMRSLAASGEASAVLCANDITAIGALKALREQKIRNISVISIDNIEEAYNTSPLLTTVNIPREDMAHMAVEVLCDRIRGGHREFLRIEFPCRIIKRESCYTRGEARDAGYGRF